MDRARGAEASKLHPVGPTQRFKFLRAVPTSESPKVMGLAGIHDPDALRHFAGFTYCP